MSKEFHVPSVPTLHFKVPRPKTEGAPFHRFEVGQTVCFEADGIEREGKIQEDQFFGYLINCDGETYWARATHVLWRNSHLIPRKTGDDVYFTIGSEVCLGTILSMTDDVFTVNTDKGTLEIKREATSPYKEIANTEAIIKGHLNSCARDFGMDLNKEIDDRRITWPEGEIK